MINPLNSQNKSNTINLLQNTDKFFWQFAKSLKTKSKSKEVVYFQLYLRQLILNVQQRGMVGNVGLMVETLAKLNTVLAQITFTFILW